MPAHQKPYSTAFAASRHSPTPTTAQPGPSSKFSPANRDDHPRRYRRDVDVAFAAARTAQAEWAQRPVSERLAVVRRYRDLVIKNREFLMDLLQAEAGKARWAAQEEIVDLMANANYYARVGAKLLKPTTCRHCCRPWVKRPSATSPGRRRRHLAVELPMTLTASDSVPALLAGNAVVLKPDSQTPYCALACAELLYQAGLPRALYAVVPGPVQWWGQPSPNSATT